MRTLRVKAFTNLICFLFALPFFSSCLTGRKMDKYLAQQYGNELPKTTKKKSADITINSAVPSLGSEISSSSNKTSKMLPLLLYWQWEYRVSTELNSAIGVTRFSNAFNTGNKTLNDKLQGKKLELTIEQMPRTFSFVDKSHIIFLLLYALSWEKVYFEPTNDELVISYKLLENSNTIKTGKISIKNNARSNGLRFFQSWKSATREQLADYDANINGMTKSFVEQLAQEL